MSLMAPVCSLPKIGIVIPIYREEKSIQRIYDRLERVTQGLQRFKWEYVFVNDGSTDQSMVVLRALAVADNKVKVIDLSRNFGKEIALTAGVHEVEGVDAVICIDADLQHPPELIPKLIDEWEAGSEVVVTIRKSIEKQPLLKRMGSHLYYWIINKISDLEIVSQTTDFRLYDKKVVEAFKHATERERMFRGIMDWLGFKRTFVEFEAVARTEGEAGYSYYKLWRLAINSITSFSLWPLRLAGYLGCLITTVTGFALLWMLINYFIQSRWIYSPLAMVVVANTFLIGIVLMAIGLVALYVGTIHTEVINRPLYVIRERMNLERKDF